MAEVYERVEQIPAAVAPDREPDNDKVDVNEVSVALDEVITDPNSELAVQVPDEGKGSTDLPIHALKNPSPEEAFAKDAKKKK